MTIRKIPSSRWVHVEVTKLRNCGNYDSYRDKVQTGGCDRWGTPDRRCLSTSHRPSLTSWYQIREMSGWSSPLQIHPHSGRLTSNKYLLPSAERRHTVNPAGTGCKPCRATSSVSPAADSLALSQLSHFLNKQNSMSCYNHHDILNITGSANEVIITLIHLLISRYFSVNTKLHLIQQFSGIYNCGHIISNIFVT